jgi:hypothetical protein
LRRFVGFLASAFDARYAFVAAYDGHGEAKATRSLALWLTKDFGLVLRSLRVELPDDPSLTSSRPDYFQALRRIWPDEKELLGLTAADCVTAPMTDSSGGLLGHIGILDFAPAYRAYGQDRLAPLARLAATKLQLWIAIPPPRE